MNKLKIEDPENFQFASAVTKDSKTGFSSNRRLLVVRGGHLYYFSNIPPFFKGNPKDLEYHHELPKHSIDLASLKKIRPYEASSCTFQIVFDEANLMERQDIRRTLVEHLNFVPKTKGEEISWKFTCDNNVLKHKWVTYLAQLKEHFQREKEQIDNYFSTLNQTQQSMSSNSSKNGKTPWRDSTVLRKQYSATDFKSVADLPGPVRDSFLDVGFKKNKEDFRLTNTYAPQVDMKDFGLEFEDLHRTEPSRELKMKKATTTTSGSSKLV